MTKLLLGAAVVMIAASPALAGRPGPPSWRSPASSDMPPVMGRVSAAYPYGPLQLVTPIPAPMGEGRHVAPKNATGRSQAVKLHML
jgi:hypothetical protein